MDRTTHHPLNLPDCKRRHHCVEFISYLCCRAENKKGRIRRVKYWEIIADNLSKAGWSWGCVSAIDSHGRTIWIADAHRGDGRESQEIWFLTLLRVIENLWLRQVR